MAHHAEDRFKTLAKKYHITPTRLKGQHFLIDELTLFDILDCARVSAVDAVVEIGPGFGVLTEELVRSAKSVLAVELDKKFVQHLQELFSKEKHITILNRDILHVSNKEITDTLGMPYRVVANIPYQITGKILRKFISDEFFKPRDMVLLVQKEVAQRVCAPAGKLSLLALSVQLYGVPRLVSIVPKNAFWPIPEVDSAILHIADISEKPRIPIANLDFFWRVLRIGFSSARKQLHNNLCAGFGLDAQTMQTILKEAGIAHTARAQSLTLLQWAVLARSLAAHNCENLSQK